MNLIGNLFRTPSKHQTSDAKPRKQVHFLSPQKFPSHAKSQTLSQDKNWAQISMDMGFYLEKIIEVKLGKTDIIPKSKEDKSHMVYQICVLTSDFQYKLKKRFSLFNEFYCQIKKQIVHLNLTFPKKTLLVSGTNIQVVSQRYELLNTFIRRIFQEVKQQKNKDIEFRFMSFLEIDEQYEKRKIKSFTELPRGPTDNNESNFCVEETSIAFQLRKLNDYNNHQRDILSRIESYITYKNYKLTNDEIKILLTGNSSANLKGLLNLSFSINNEIKALQLLRFLVDYLSPAKKSYNDKIYKQFEKLPLEAFHFSYDLVKNNFAIIEFKKIFFIILELYCQNKLFSQTKILQLYPELLDEFELWKNLYEFNQGNFPKKTSSVSNSHFQELLKKPMSATHLQKAKSFEINPKLCETRADSLYPLIGTQNMNFSATKSTQSEEKQKKYSFRSNDSTSELTIEEDWEMCKMRLELGENEEELAKMQVLKSSSTFSLKSNKVNKLSIQILKTQKKLEQCEELSNTWNKLIYDERHDPFTGISRIYMKLNGKSKIFKYKQEDQKIEKKNENLVSISKKRLESHNSFAKSGKQNLEESLRMKVNSPSNGFEQIITIENINQEVGNEQTQHSDFRKVTIDFNFEGEEDYFKTQILGSTNSFLQNAIQAFLD